MGLSFITPGRIRSPEIMIRPDSFTASTLLIPMTVAVLERPNGDVVLVDCGFSRAELEDPGRQLGFHALITTVVGTPADCAASQLQARGIEASQVTHIVATHLHLDHIGGDFPNAEIVAPAAEFSSGQQRGTLAGYIHVSRLLRTGRARPILWAGEGAFGFPRHFDLFGDGTVVLLDARGHTAGSAAVLLTDGDDSVLMAGDAAYSGAEYRLARFSRLMKWVGWDPDKIRSIRRSR